MTGLTDADRLDMLRALGARTVEIRDAPILALHKSETFQSEFGDARVSTTRNVLRCLWSDVQQHEIQRGDIVHSRGSTFYVAEPPADEDGMARIEIKPE